ncbi:hypothetical protein [Thermostichus sp. MS-CIW-23]
MEATAGKVWKRVSAIWKANASLLQIQTVLDILSKGVVLER